MLEQPLSENKLIRDEMIKYHLNESGDTYFIKLEDFQAFLKELKEKTYLLISWHFDEIQKILAKKEKGESDINLDILYKVHNNALSDCRQISSQVDTLAKQKFGDKLV